MKWPVLGRGISGLMCAIGALIHNHFPTTSKDVVKSAMDSDGSLISIILEQGGTGGAVSKGAPVWRCGDDISSV